jgi:glycosyltransferase involved in cell wall biosynthesis
MDTMSRRIGASGAGHRPTVSTPPPAEPPQAAAPDAAHLREQLRTLAAGQPVVCFANDWVGDPTSKHHIMRALGAHTRVLWVESSGMRRPDLTSVGDLRRIARKLRKAAPRRARPRQAPPPPPEGVRVISPLSLPFPGSRLAENINGLLYQRVLRGNAPEEPLHWVYTPTVAPYLHRFPGRGLIYHCVDRWWAFGEYDGKVMRRHHASLCEMADVVFASSGELLKDCQAHTDRAHLMRHGVDWEHFARAALEPPPVPEELADIEGPIAGFFGLIHDWIDQDLLVEAARALPDVTFVLIGRPRVLTSRLQALPNIRLLGQKPYERLPAFAARFDVGLIPFLVNELTRAVNPIKLREYLSAGLPVVSTALPELYQYADHPVVDIADGHAAFIAALRSRLDERGTVDRSRTSRGMAHESWIGRCVEMLGLWRSASAVAA